MLHLLFADPQKIATIEDDLTSDNHPRGVGNETHDGERAHTLAAGALPNKAYALSPVDMIGKTVNGPQLTIPGVEIGPQILDFKYFLGDDASPPQKRKAL